MEGRGCRKSSICRSQVQKVGRTTAGKQRHDADEDDGFMFVNKLD